MINVKIDLIAGKYSIVCQYLFYFCLTADIGIRYQCTGNISIDLSYYFINELFIWKEQNAFGASEWLLFVYLVYLFLLYAKSMLMEE